MRHVATVKDAAVFQTGRTADHLDPTLLDVGREDNTAPLDSSSDACCQTLVHRTAESTTDSQSEEKMVSPRTHTTSFFFGYARRVGR